MRGLKSSLKKLRRVDMGPLRRSNATHAAVVEMALTKPIGLTDAEADRLRAIEDLRSAMLADHTMLDEWTRHWLAESAELRERVGADNSEAGFPARMTIARAAAASKAERECRKLYALVRQCRPTTVVEMGTNVGISGAYIAAALEANGAGKVTTMEGSEPKLRVAQAGFATLGLADRVSIKAGDFNETLGETLLALDPVDFAFIDGFHDGAATVRYHEQFKEACAPGAVLVYDDIHWSDGMKDAWAQIQADPDVDAAVDGGVVGVCLLRE